MNKNGIRIATIVLGLIGAAAVNAATDWSTQDYDLYPGDFDGDGKTDLLYVAKDASKASGIARSDGTGPNLGLQSWSSTYLGISWSGNTNRVVVADFNGDNKSDLFLQGTTASSNSFLLLADASGKFAAITQTIASTYQSLEWTADKHRIIAGDFNGDGKSDLFLQAVSSTGTNAVFAASASGQFTTAAAQTWTDATWTAFKWSTQNSILYAGDFNGDGRDDLLVQARPKIVMIDYDVTIPVPTYPPNTNGVVLAQSGSAPFQQVGVQQWSRTANGVDWSPQSSNVVVGDFNGDGRDDVVLQSRVAGRNSYLVTGNASGAAFSSGTALASNVTWSGDSYRLITGNFDGAGGAGMYFQATTASGTNYYANSVTGGSVTQTAHTTFVPTAPASVAAGRMRGNFAVSNAGAATYTIPLWTPPGVGTVQLSLALAYSSRAGNGVVGMGWSLAGLSAITRCNKTFAQDTNPAPVTNTLADRFCLDGQQLKLVSGTGAYGSSGSVYATEVESFSKIVANGAVGNGPQSFTVTTKNGLIYDYGTTFDSRILAGGSGTVRTWAVSVIRDRVGNKIDLAYVNDSANGTYRVQSIRYPTTATGQGPFYEVLFGYSARPSNDIPSGYLVGNAVREAYKLDNITIRSIGNLLPTKAYYLSYAQGSTTNRLRLTSVKECSAGACFPPTNVTYQNGTQGWSTTATSVGVNSSAASGVGPMALDLNGDGLTDIVYPVVATGSTSRWWATLATTSGFAAAIDTGVTTANTDKTLIGAFSGKGQMQLLMVQSGTWNLVAYNGSSFTSTSTGVAFGGEFTAVDYDGDGLPDLVSVVSTDVRVRRNTTAPAGAVSFASTAQTVTTITQFQHPGTNGFLSLTSFADFNGDGRGDLLVAGLGPFGSVFLNALYSNGFGAAATVTTMSSSSGPVPIAGDWNADGCTDFTRFTHVYISNCKDSFTELNGSVVGSPSAYLSGDWDGDGRMDLLYSSSLDNQWYVMRSTGEGIAAATSVGLAAPTSTAWFAFDQNGDGLVDLAFRDGNNGNALKYHLHAGASQSGDLATNFTDAFGIAQSPTYVSIARNNYSKYSDATFPEVDYQGSLYVVDQFTASTGAGDTYQNQFWYYGARIHQQGRGFLGFYAQRTYDPRTTLNVYDYVYRSFPGTGLQYQRLVRQSDGPATPVSDTIGTVSSQVTGGSTGVETRYFPFISNVTTSRYELGGALNGSLIAQSSTTYAYADGYGNTTQINSSQTDKDPNSPFFNLTWTNTLNATFENDAGNSCFGLLKTAAVQSVVPGQATAQRSSSYVVDGAKCRATQRVTEPSIPALKVTTNLGFDTCGNVNSLQVTGANPDGTAMSPRVTTMNYGSRCQLPESVNNALNQTTALAYRYDFGIPIQTTDPNGLTARWQYDDFGRKTTENRPDQTSTTWTFTACTSPPCWGVSDLRFLVDERPKDVNGQDIMLRSRFYDGVDRLRYDENNRVLGTWTNEVFVYDSLGRLATQHRPYSSASNGWETKTYDALNRVTAIRLYQPSGTLDRTTTVAYAGGKTTVTDPLNHSRSQVRDVYGFLRRSIDPSPGGTSSFNYDAFGNLNRIEDPLGAVSTGVYNLRGFRTQWADADRGTWNFTANSLNELVGWTDAKNQPFSATYDPLGRRTSRTEPEGTSTWTWGNSAANKDIGQLVSMSGLGMTEEYSYDSVGRLAQRKVTTDQAYYFNLTYNSIGTVDTVTYPDSPVPSGQSATRFKVKYEYSYGRPYKISNVTDATSTLWQVTQANDYESPKQESFGASVVAVASGYKDWTNELTSLQAGVGGSATNRMNLAYSWDTAGNLSQRQDVAQSLTEAFTYDALDRPTGSTLNGGSPQVIGYNASGNVTDKTGVGTYAYTDATHPHAVTAAGASEARGYDANGNVTTINTQVQTWASYNLPTLLKRSATDQSQLFYGPEHQRWKQVAADASGTETTLYVGEMLEKVTKGAVTYWRHMVPTPSGHVIVVSRNSNNTGTTTFDLTDHIGSSSTLLSDTGAVRTNLSFDAYGQRRGANWSSATPPDWTNIAATTRRGFTFHEQLDTVALTHMNGRVYDPKLGRFLSVDPLIGDLGDSQSINPYAYVGNRPLSHTDPSGLVVDGCFGCSIWLPSVVATIGNFLFGGSSPPPPPPAISLPGQSAQNGVGICGPGNTTASCGGLIVYMEAPSGDASVPSSRPGRLEDYSDPFRDPTVTFAFTFIFKGKAYTYLEHTYYIHSYPFSADEVMPNCEVQPVQFLDPSCDGLKDVLFFENLVPMARLAMEAWAARAAIGVAADAKFAQTTYSSVFGKKGLFAGKSVEQVAAALRSGAMKASEVPINYIVRDGETIILNTRSAKALELAGIPRSQWNGINQTGNQMFEELLDGQLARNPGGPFKTVRPSGKP
jgi:RHS repeat-associated protein